MQESDRKDEKLENWAEPTIAIHACPRCGNRKIGRSSKKIKDSILNILFYKAYRCLACRYRFWVMNPLRLILFAGLMLLLIPIFGAVWMSTHQQPAVATIAQTVSNDQIKRLAEKGDAEAELQMGLRHTSTARGVKNDKIAVQWFEKAAQHGQVEAQYRYGLALLNGQGIVQDYKTAFHWLEKAAQQGQAQAQSNLGDMYYTGIAINKDIERAYLWFNLAAAQGVESAATNRDIVVKLLAPNQIAALQEEAGRISRGYRSTYVADEPTTVILEPYPEKIDTPPPDDSMPVAEEPTVKSVILMLKDWWKKQP
jgi:predicted RNA-binding Zn-ribbon protein involved in translation (DUF1610 family)